MEKPKQSSLNSPDESKAISTNEDFGTQVEETSFHGPKPVGEKVEGESDVEKDGEEQPTDDRVNDDDHVEEEPVYEDEAYDRMEPPVKREKKRKVPKSDWQRGKEKRKGDQSKKKGNRKDRAKFSNIS